MEDADRSWPLPDGLSVDLDGPYINFPDGSCGRFDGDYDCGLVPEDASRVASLEALGQAITAIADDDAHNVDTWLIETEPVVRTFDVEHVEGVAFHPGRTGVCALIDLDLPRYADEAFEERIPGVIQPLATRAEPASKLPTTSAIGPLAAAGTWS